MAVTAGQTLLVADDFGLGREHDAVILDLLEHRRIGATSVMVDGDIAPADISKLISLRNAGCQVGLHLNLTYDFGGGQPNMPAQQLLQACLTSGPPAEFSQSFGQQAEGFRDIFGFWPDFYDGHQHCHCFPSLSQAAADLPRHGTCWMRVPRPRGAVNLMRNVRAGGSKVLIIATLARFARARFQAQGWPVNSDFSGFLKLSDPAKVAHWMPRLLAAAGPDCVFMVHPGSAESPMQCDGHAAQSRQIEANLLVQGSIEANHA